MKCVKCGATSRTKACKDTRACADRVLDKASRHLAAVESARQKAGFVGLRQKGESTKDAEIRFYREAMGE